MYHHEKGFIGSLTWIAGKLYSGGKDGKVVITDTETMTAERGISFGVLPRAIDVLDTKMVVGLRNGSIIECDLESEEMTTYQ